MWDKDWFCLFNHNLSHFSTDVRHRQVLFIQSRPLTPLYQSETKTGLICSITTSHISLPMWDKDRFRLFNQDLSHLSTNVRQRLVLYVQSRNTCRTRKQHSLSEEQERFCLGAEACPSEHGTVLQGRVWLTAPQTRYCKQASRLTEVMCTRPYMAWKEYICT